MIKTLGIYKFFGVNVYNLCLKHFIYFELALCWFLSSLPIIWLTRLSKMYRWSHLNLQCHSCSVEQCNDAKQIELRQKFIIWSDEFIWSSVLYMISVLAVPSLVCIKKDIAILLSMISVCGLRIKVWQLCLK